MNPAEQLTAELTDLLPRVPPHWRGYIEVRLEASKCEGEDAEAVLERCRDWTRKYAPVDGVAPPDSVLVQADDESPAGVLFS